MEIYKEVLPPISGQLEWAETRQPAPLAPNIYKSPGKPPKQRKRASDEPRNPYKASKLNRPIRCGKCKKEWHNSKGCKAGITGETPWQRRQRLEKEKVVSKWDVNGTNKKTKKNKKLFLNLQRYLCIETGFCCRQRERCLHLVPNLHLSLHPSHHPNNLPRPTT